MCLRGRTGRPGRHTGRESTHTAPTPVVGEARRVLLRSNCVLCGLSGARGFARRALVGARRALRKPLRVLALSPRPACLRSRVPSRSTRAPGRVRQASSRALRVLAERRRVPRARCRVRSPRSDSGSPSSEGFSSASLRRTRRSLRVIAKPTVTNCGQRALAVARSRPRGTAQADQSSGGGRSVVTELSIDALSDLPHDGQSSRRPGNIPRPRATAFWGEFNAWQQES